ncbi:hypothetical protein RIF29_04742 [Crotalaria pallida]|uniref:Glycosyl hydrolase family 63 C-terminal domain-containing protein n=1 Tax=Crotalaria pallida TaxID=3830 RepID=A0AAN9J1A9_CROPI
MRKRKLLLADLYCLLGWNLYLLHLLHCSLHPLRAASHLFASCVLLIHGGCMWEAPGHAVVVVSQFSPFLLKEVVVKRFLDQDISGESLEEFKSEITNKHANIAADAWWMWASPGCAVVVGVSIFTFFVEDIVNGLKNNEFTVTDRSEISVFLEHAFIRLEAWFQWFNTTHSGCYDCPVCKITKSVEVATGDLLSNMMFHLASFMDNLMEETHELGGFTVLVDRAMPKLAECHQDAECHRDAECHKEAE